MRGLGTLGFVAIIVGMLASVTIHEWGHFITARRFGMKATQFMVGFGPTIWSKVRGETEYGVKALPLGGYVKIMGMTDLEPVAPEDLPRAFYRQPPGRRAVVLVSGSVMHFVIAAVLLLIAPMFFGIETQPTTTISGVVACAPDQVDGSCSDPAGESPAKAAGLQPGDRITSVAGEPIDTWDEFTASLTDKPGQTVVIGYERDGEPQTATLTVARGERPDPDDPDQTVVRGVIGVSPGAEAVRKSPGEALVGVGTTMVTFVRGTFEALWQLPAKIPALWDSLVNDAPRDPNGLVGVVGISRVGSDILSDDATPFMARVGFILFLLAGVNIFLGIFNLLPLLPLDGGQLAVLGYEQLRSWWARRRGRPDPGRVDLAKLMPVTYVFIVLVLGLTVLLLAADLLNPIDLGV